MGQIEQNIAGIMERLTGPLSTINTRTAALDLAVRGNIERLDAAEQRSASIEQTVTTAVVRLDGADERTSRVEQVFGERLAGIEQGLKTVGDYIDRLEHAIDSVRQDGATLRQNVSEDLKMFETALNRQAGTLEKQGAAIESARTAVAQTDDLVERVVEALDSLQLTVLEQADDRTADAL